MLETKRLAFRRWEESDADNLYKYASDPEVGPIAGWPAHRSVDESREVIKNVFTGKEAYAICLKPDNEAIGAIELKLNGHTDMTDRDDECELGYWLGKPFWGKGIMPEAARELLRHAFEDCGMSKVWCGYYEGNDILRRAQLELRRLAFCLYILPAWQGHIVFDRFVYQRIIENLFLYMFKTVIQILYGGFCFFFLRFHHNKYFV